MLSIKINILQGNFRSKISAYMNAKCSLKSFTNFSLRQCSTHHVYKYCPEIEEAVNKQIQMEHQAAITYLALAVNFLHPSVSYYGAGGYFMKNYKEELDHMDMLLRYQLIRGGKPILSESKSVNLSLTLVAAFSEALALERSVTEHLEKIVTLAEAKNDYQSADFITAKFLEHQMQSLSELSYYVTVLNKLGDNQHALYYFDQQLSKSNPYSLKS